MAFRDCKCTCKAGSKKFWRRLAMAVLLLTVAALASVQVVHYFIALFQKFFRKVFCRQIHKYFQKVTIVGRNVKRKDSMFLPAFR